MINASPQDLAIAGHKVHYAWVIVMVAAALRLSGSAVRTSFSILLPRLVETFGWSIGAVGGILAVQWIFSGLFGPYAGWLGDRYGIRRTMTVGALLFVSTMVGSSLVMGSNTANLLLFYLIYGVLLSGAMAIFQVPLTAAVTMWFRKHLGLGMGILQSSQGMGPLVFVPLVLFIIHAFGGGESGLRAAFWVTGVAGGVIMLLLIRPFYNEPAQVGLRPMGAPEQNPVNQVKKQYGQSIAFLPDLRGFAQRRHGHFPGPLDRGGDDVVPEASGAGNGDSTVLPGNGAPGVRSPGFVHNPCFRWR